MNGYDGPPKCQGCGGRLDYSAEVCRCGGRSQYYERSTVITPSGGRLNPLDYSTEGRRWTVAEALAELDRRRVSSP